MITDLILASKSPQRKRILEDMGLHYKAVPSHIDETAAAAGLKRYSAIAKRIALRKAERVAEDFSAEWVLGCDTFVILSDGSLSVKPKGRSDARRTIRKYCGSYCDVYSGVALVNLKKGKKFVEFDKTRLYFRKFSEADLEAYLDSGEWKGRSGSMTIEGKGGKWVTRMKGDYWNVVGLPVDLLKTMLIRAGR